MPPRDTSKRNGGYGTGREALLEAVVQIVGREGLKALTYRKVAEVAGVDNTLISHHFGSKAVLLEAAMDYAAQRTLEGADFDRLFHGGIAENVLALVAEGPEMQTFQYEMVLAARATPALKPAAQRLYCAYVQQMQAALAVAGYAADEALARMIFATLDGLVFQRVTTATEEQIRAALEQVELLLRDRLVADPASPSLQ